MTLLNKHLSGAQGVWWWNTVQQTDQKRNWNREVCYSQFLSSGRIKDAPWGGHMARSRQNADRERTWGTSLY